MCTQSMQLKIVTIRMSQLLNMSGLALNIYVLMQLTESIHQDPPALLKDYYIPVPALKAVTVKIANRLGPITMTTPGFQWLRIQNSLAKGFVEEKLSPFTVNKSGSLQKVRKDLKVALRVLCHVEMGSAFQKMKSVLSHHFSFFQEILS